MKNFIKNFIRTGVSLVLTQESGNTINSSIFKFKNKHSWIYKSIYGSTNDDEIIDNILQKFDGKIDCLMIHSSFNDMLPMYTGNLSSLLTKIISYCEKNSITLVIPTFFNGSIWEAKEYYKNNIFDVSKTVSGMGLLSELFRRIPNVKRSVHPSHSVCALGPLADQLTKNHHKANTTFGEGTPFGEMAKYKTKILGLGLRKNQSLTQIHSPEDMMKENFPIKLHSESLPVTCIDESGNTLIYYLKIRNSEYIYDSNQINKILGKIVVEWTFKGIPFYLTEANLINETIIGAAKNNRTIYKKR